MIKFRLSIMFFLAFTFTTLAEASAESGFVPVKGGSLYYEISGEGEPLVLLHGGPGLDHSYFLPQINVLNKKYKLIMFDQRACGKSSVMVDSNSITMDQFVEDLEKLREYFKLEKMNLLGHSFGGLLAMRYAIKYPEHLKSLILVNSSSPSSQWRDSSFAYMNQRNDSLVSSRISALTKTEAFRQRDPDTMSVFFKLLFKKSFYQEEKADDLNISFQRNYAASSRMMQYLNKDTSLNAYNLEPELKKLKVPALIIGSEADIAPPMMMEALHKDLKNSDYTFIESAGHFPFIEQPELFLKAIDKFFGRF